ncbi:MAG: glycosyltransferase family 39 protein [Chloroflexi bacterium]|nr:glycosyltransferase family 39 protein [Chloroflexota bacterium]
MTASRRTRWLVWGLVILAAALRLYWGTRSRVVWGDEPFYLWLGQSLLDGQGYQFFGISAVHHSPLFALLAASLSRVIAPLAGLAGGSPAALIAGSVAVHVSAGALLVWPVFGIARRLTGTGPALAAALATAVSPALAVAPLLWGTMTEPIYLLAVALGFWGLFIAMEDGKLAGYALAGAGFALAYLTRSEAIVYVVGGLAAALLLRIATPPAAFDAPGTSDAAGVEASAGCVVQASNRPKAQLQWGGNLLRSLTMGRQRARRESTPYVSGDRPERGRRWWVRTAAGIGLALVIFFVLISPYLIVLKERTGKWQLLEEAGSTYVSAQGLAYGDTAAFDAGTWGLDSASGEVYYFSDTSAGQGLAEAIVANPAEFARRLRVNVKDLVAGLTGWRLLGWPLIALALLGLFNRPWDGRRLRGELLLAVVLAGPLSFVLFFIQDRYLAAALIPALIWVGGGAAWLGEWLAGTIADCRLQIADGRLQMADSRLQMAEEQHATRSTQHATRNTQHATRNTQHATRNTQHAARSTQHATRNTQHATRSTQHATRNTQHATRNTQHATRSTQHATRSTQISISRLLPAIFLALALLWQQPRLWAALQETHSFQPGHLAAAEELAAAGATPDAVVMSRYPAVAFHAAAAWAPTPAAAWPDVVAYAAKRHAAYLVVDEWETRLRPALRPLLDPAAAPAGLRHLATLGANGERVVIYRFQP